MQTTSYQSENFRLLNKELAGRNEYPKLAMVFFNRAIARANAKSNYEAIELAGKALFYVRFGEPYQVLKVYSLLCWLYYETKNSERAVRVCKQALAHIKLHDIKSKEKHDYFIALLHYLKPQQTHEMHQTELKIAV